jgi:hypothetical protein
MALPSKYAPQGLSAEQQRQTITSGKPFSRKPTNYVFRAIEDRVESAHQNNEDIEMVPMDDETEVGVISDYVATRRLNNELPAALSRFQDSVGALEADPKGFLVVDTNFILSHLNILDELKTMAAQYRLQIVVPMTTMLELDGLKRSQREASPPLAGGRDTLLGTSVGHLARWANDWIYSALAQCDASVRGQRVSERLDRTLTQDDAILDCCLYLQQQHPKSVVVLLSNDKNFCLKALSNDVLTVSYRPGMSAQNIAQMVFAEMKSRFGAAEDMKVEDTAMEETEAPPVADKYSLVYRETEALLVHVVKRCMRQNYGDDLDLVRGYNEAEVATLPQCAQLIDRFWVTVFSGYFMQRRLRVDRTQFRELDSVPQDLAQLHAFLHHWTLVLRILYDAEMDEDQRTALAVLTKRWLAL